MFKAERKLFALFLTFALLTVMFPADILAESTSPDDFAAYGTDVTGLARSKDDTSPPKNGFDVESFSSHYKGKTKKHMSIMSDSLSCSVDGTTLTISGNGAMSDYSTSHPAPWAHYKDEITHVIISPGVTSIGILAFYDFQALQQVSLPETLTAINDAAFYGCSSLTSANLPSNLTSIGAYIFEGTAVESITVPAKTTSIDTYAFGASKLKTINVSASNPSFKSVNGVLYNKNGDTLITYPGMKTDSSFSVPSGTKTIGESAFNGVQYLKAVSLGSVTKILSSAFAYSSIENIIIPDSVTELGMMTFWECDNLKSIDFGKGVKTIEYRTCIDCTNLETIVLRNVESIENGAFIRTSIKNLFLPSSLKSVGVAAFGECGELVSVDAKGLEGVSYQTFQGCTKLSSVSLNEGIKNIYGYAFRFCDSLSSITIPASCTFVHESAIPLTTQVTNKNPDMMEYGYKGWVDTLTITGTNDYEKAYQVLDLVNQERSRNGLAPLKMDKVLLDDAMLRAAEIVVHFSHGRPNGDSVVGTNSWFSYYPGLNIVQGENIAMGSSTASGVMNQWMNSQGHKDNILDKDWTTIGIGCFVYNNSLYWVQCFSTKEENTDFSKPSNRKVKAPIHIDENPFEDRGDNDKQVNFQFTILGTKTITVGQKQALDLKMNNVTFDRDSVDWKSASGKHASIDVKGIVTGNAAGTAKITASSRGFERAARTITVNEADGSSGSTGGSVARNTPFSKVDAIIKGIKNDKDPAGSTFADLQLKQSIVTKNSIKISWKKFKGAEKYVIYANKCGKKTGFKKVKTTKGKAYTLKKIEKNKLKKGTYYKLIVVAVGKDNKVLSTSKIVHIATKGGKAGNHKKITTKARKNKLTIIKGKQFKLAAKAVSETKKNKVKKHRAIQYESTNKNIATVSKKGIVKAKKKGKCYIYAYAQNGIFRKIKISVK